MYAYLTLATGDSPNAVFPLDPQRENQIGRGLECAISLGDPMCSRVHAVVVERDRAWWVRDGGSRNGTFVNGQKVDEAMLAEGHRLRVGNTEFIFHQADQPPTVEGRFAAEQDEVQSIIRNVPLGAEQAVTTFGNSATQPDEDLHLLYQLSCRLLEAENSLDVLRPAMDLLLQRTEASVVGFLWLDEQGRLRPKLVFPESRRDAVELSQSLTHLVRDERRAVWIANQRAASSAESLQAYADALCVPLLDGQRVIGAIHVYREQSRFRQSHFDFAIAVAALTGTALSRARRSESLQSDYRHLKDQSPGFDELIGESPAMRELKAKVQRLAPTGGCVLIRGESGVGKELIARALHRHSSRADRPLLTVNCAAIPGTLMESQLFGHKAGAFTGADRDHVGYFQQADTGTLFLDEISELSLEGQAKLLRVLEGHPFLPVGGTKEVSVDVRVIAASNQDLRSYVREKKFREDLYYRLSNFELVVPPLRERGEDLDRLIDFFLEHFRRQRGRPELALSEAARRRLRHYPWPGNVRQLRNVLDSAVVLAGQQIEASDLSLPDAGDDLLETLRLDHWERRLIGLALERTAGNVPEAARLLGIGRATLYRKIDEYGLKR